MSLRPGVLGIAQLLTVAGLLGWSAASEARATSDLFYPVDDIFSTAVRYVRIDRSCKIIDKDGAAAFLSFECKEGEKAKHGSLEIFKSSAQGREAVRVQVTLGDEPHYVELRFLELLERKLRDERGIPLPAPPLHLVPTDGAAP